MVSRAFSYAVIWAVESRWSWGARQVDV